MSHYKVGAQALEELCTAILEKKGISKKDAVVIAESLVEADLRGVNSHGVIRMGIYVQRLENGIIKREPDIQIAKETESTLVIDGDNGFGQVVSEFAVQKLLEKSDYSNISAVAVRRSNHFGAGAYWSMKMINNDLIGISLTNAEALMPPTGGIEARVGNNPLSVAVPAQKEKPIVLDMATSVVALGKIVTAQSKGESIPEGWGVNRLGQITTNPKEVINGGNLFPVGGPKGYGLAVVIDILTSLLSQGAFGNDIYSLYNDLDKPNDISHFFLALKIDGFVNKDIFKNSVDQYIQYIKNTSLTPGNEQIFLPGEIELLKKEKNLQEGIQLPVSVFDELLTIAKSVGVNEVIIGKVENTRFGAKDVQLTE